MKPFWTLTMICLSTVCAWAQTDPDTVETVEIERSRSVYDLTIELNSGNVRCLVGDYGQSSLKISIPEMKQYTVFPHTTRGEVQPCINAGACKTPWIPDGFSPDLVIDPAKPTENIRLTVVLTEALSLNQKLKTCTRTLRENVDAPVRGLKFAHQDGAWLGDLNYEVCLKMKETEAEKASFR